METLEGMRKSIDNIDSAIIAMFAERFNITNRVGYFKAEHKLVSRDPAREIVQHERIRSLAQQYGLDPEFAESYLDAVIARVVKNHEQISAQSGPNHG